MLIILWENVNVINLNSSVENKGRFSNFTSTLISWFNSGCNNAIETDRKLQIKYTNTNTDIYWDANILEARGAYKFETVKSNTSFSSVSLKNIT